MEALMTLPRWTPAALEIGQMPKLNFLQVINLTDDTGIIQHAIFNIPNRKEGYCIDDNSRALMLAVWAANHKKDQTYLNLLQVYLSFIHYMQTDTGEFKNFMSYTKECLEERGSEDSFGRTVMALGYLANEGPSNALIKTGVDIFVRAYPNIEKLQSIRGIANSIIGVCQFIKFNAPDDIKKELVIRLADKMVDMYNTSKHDEWKWFEPILTYDNAFLPLALLHAYEITGDENYSTVAFEAMDFLESNTLQNDVLSLVGNQGWLTDGGLKAPFDQQAIDAMAMVLFYQQAYHVTSDAKYLNRMYLCYQWFLGNNDLKMPLYDSLTGGCADGLHSEGINFNQGAESTLAYWISHMVVLSALKS